MNNFLSKTFLITILSLFLFPINAEENKSSYSHEYNFYVSFYRMTKYFTNIILLLNEYYLCAAFHYGVHRDQRVRDGNAILRSEVGLFAVHLRRKLSLCPHLFRRSRPQALRTRSWLRRHYMPGGLLYVREKVFFFFFI